MQLKIYLIILGGLKIDWIELNWLIHLLVFALISLFNECFLKIENGIRESDK